MMGDVMKEASFSLTEAYFAAGDFRYIIFFVAHFKLKYGETSLHSDILHGNCFISIFMTVLGKMLTSYNTGNLSINIID